MEPMKELSDGPLHSFAIWPNAAVPRIAIGCYSIWRDEQLVYVGVAGRALDPAKVATLRQKKGRPCPRAGWCRRRRAEWRERAPSGAVL